MTDVAAGTPYDIPSFGGLNLDIDPEEAGATRATDLINVDLDREGRVRSRIGYTLVKSLTMTTPAGLTAFSTTSGTRQVVVGHTTGGTPKYEAYASTGGATVATQTVGASVISAARIGTTANEYLYLANGVDTVWRWTGAAFSQPAGMPAATYLAVAPRSNRLVAGGITGTSLSRVQFSDAGAPETWGANNFVTLTPGDGSSITGMATWQDQVFVFKRDRHFVFGQESIDASGNPVFNYRAVDTYGALVPPVAGREGVFFFDGRVVWLTTGGIPVRISRPVEPFFADALPINGEYVLQDTQSTIRLSYSLGRLYVSITESLTSSRRCLVYDPRFDTWTYYSTHFFFGADLQIDSSDQVYTYWLADTGIARFDPGGGTITDNGTPFDWFWQSGWYRPAPGRTATSLESSINGSGQITLQVANDYAALDAGSLVIISSPGTYGQGWQQLDREGRLWQHRVSGTGAGGAGAFVGSLAHYITHTR